MGEGSSREAVDGGEAPAKRAKGTPPLESILLLTFPASQAAAQPQVNWLQFLCILSEYMFGVLDVNVPISSNRRRVSGFYMFLRINVFEISLVQDGAGFFPVVSMSLSILLISLSAPKAPNPKTNHPFSGELSWGS
jgi:hypothetical protein